MENGKARPIFKSPRTDWCKAMDKSANNNLFVRMFISVVKPFAPELIHSCPYFGVYDVKNATYLKHIVHVLPSGFYKFKYKTFTLETEVYLFVLDFLVS